MGNQITISTINYKRFAMRIGTNYIKYIRKLDENSMLEFQNQQG